VIYIALQALYTVRESGTIIDPGWRWRREEYEEPDRWDLP
jgi:hypothetical protein